MTKAERWLKETMTVRRWLVVVCGVAVLATVAAFGALSAIRSDDALPDDLTPTGANGEQRPSSMFITANVGSIGVLDGRANVALDVYLNKGPVAWTVTVRTIPGTGMGNATVREIELKNEEARNFAAALDDAVHHPDPDNDVTVGGATIHAVVAGPTEYQFEIKCIGAIRLDADGMSDLKRMLDKAEAQRLWLHPRTVALRVPTAAPPAMAEVRSTSAIK